MSFIRLLTLEVPDHARPRHRDEGPAPLPAGPAEVSERVPLKLAALRSAWRDAAIAPSGGGGL